MQNPQSAIGLGLYQTWRPGVSSSIVSHHCLRVPSENFHRLRSGRSYRRRSDEGDVKTAQASPSPFGRRLQADSPKLDIADPQKYIFEFGHFREPAEKAAPQLAAIKLFSTSETDRPQHADLAFSAFSPARNSPVSQTQATLAQLVEHSIRNRKVVGSNPTGGSIKIKCLEAVIADWIRIPTRFPTRFGLCILITESFVLDST